MSCKETNEDGCFTLTWKIENFSSYMATVEPTGIRLRSPVWKTEFIDGNTTWWSLEAYLPRSSGLVIKLTCLSLTCLKDLQKYFDCTECKMYVVTSSAEIEMSFETAEDKNDCYFRIEEKILFGEKYFKKSVPQDTLVLYCRMRQRMIKTEQCLIRSVLHPVTFLWNIVNDLFEFIWVDRTVHQQGNVLLFISLFRSKDRHGSYLAKVDLQTNLGRKADFVYCNVFIDNNRGSFVLEENDLWPCVCFRWDLDISVGNGELRLASNRLMLDSIVAEHVVAYQGSPKTLKDDLLALYRERTLSDANLNTKDESFPAHRSILAARSPVFRAMFEARDASEGRSGVVAIDDIDSETVDRMLRFLYGDVFKDLQWDEALALYYAADKYDVQLLKQKCVDVLKARLVVDKVCDGLVLSDRHSDDELMEFVVDFICYHQDVLDSPEWVRLEEDNPRLTTKVLRDVIRKM